MRTVLEARVASQRAERVFPLLADSPADSRRHGFVGGVIWPFFVVVGMAVSAVVASLIPGCPSPISCRKPPVIKDNPARVVVDSWRPIKRRTMKDRRDSWRTLIALVKT